MSQRIRGCAGERLASRKSRSASRSIEVGAIAAIYPNDVPIPHLLSRRLDDVPLVNVGAAPPRTHVRLSTHSRLTD
jgi:hypothetical protein